MFAAAMQIILLKKRHLSLWLFFLQPVTAQTTTSISHQNPTTFNPGYGSEISATPSCGLEDKQQDYSTQTMDQKTGVLLREFLISMNYALLALLALIVFSFLTCGFLCVLVLSHQ